MKRRQRLKQRTLPGLERAGAAALLLINLGWSREQIEERLDEEGPEGLQRALIELFRELTANRRPPID
jgi:hypothetical protein